jgi:hypothetical protein
MLQNDTIGFHHVGIAHLKDTLHAWRRRLSSQMDLDLGSSPNDVNLRWQMLPRR